MYHFVKRPDTVGEVAQPAEAPIRIRQQPAPGAVSARVRIPLAKSPDLPQQAIIIYDDLSSGEEVALVRPMAL